MNKTKMLCAASAAMVLTFAGAATTYEVHTVVELTNACTKATTNFDTIKIYPGTYDLTGIAMATEVLNKKTKGIHLQFKKNYMKILGMGSSPAETVIKGGGAVDKQRLISFAGNYNTISNLTFTGGYVDTASGSGGVCVGRNQTFVDCRFLDNYADNFAGAVDQPTTVTKCYFENNAAANSGGVYRGANGVGTFTDCTFVNNRSKDGGIGYGAAVFSGCVFANNSSTTGYGILKSGGTAASFTDCVISNTYTGGSYSVCDAVGGITNCTFVGNCGGVWGESGDTLIANCPSVVGCSFLCNTGMPMIIKSTLRNCVLKDNIGHRLNSNPLFGSSTFYSCLFARNRAGNHSMSCLAGTHSSIPSLLFNCTVVSNGYYASNYSIVEGGTCVNSILADNYLCNDTTGKTTLQDIGTHIPDAMTNCLWTAQNKAPSAEKAVGCQLVTDEQLRFTDAANGDYTIKRKSVARNAGWSDAAYLLAVGPYDLKGDPRVNADDDTVRIDIGAYECCIPTYGTQFFLR